MDGLGGDFDLSQHFSSLQSLVQLTAHAEPEQVEPPAEPAAAAEPALVSEAPAGQPAA